MIRDMDNKEIRNLKVAIITDHIQNSGGAIRVTKEIGKMFNSPDYYFLFGDKRKASEILDSDNIYFSKLQKFPFLKKLYKYTYFLWPLYIESLNLKDYDLVISSSFSVAHGVITSEKTTHISYIHSPMRYAWDMKDRYFNKKRMGIKMLPISILTNYLRLWDTFSSSRSDILLSNSSFVSKRVNKYWKRDSEILHPPVDLYDGDIKKSREDYFVTGAPFEINKNGEVLINHCIANNIDLKIVGTHHCLKRWKRRYKRYSNIEFLGYLSDYEKFNVLSDARGYVSLGVEDFGIFPVESISCGTPVVVLNRGGYRDYVQEGINGVYVENLSLDSFRDSLERFESIVWDYDVVSNSVRDFSTERFIKKLKSIILKNI